MATIYWFGSFQLDDGSEISFRGEEPTTVGQCALTGRNGDASHFLTGCADKEWGGSGGASPDG
ncbi:hypothetical protein [Bradyrhizobium betae]|uniref:Uncharacterized protein n=1 Tax=Bradyrhizobium betae TaxID=244734 RepID=A0A4Q1UV67_9BRAD|nr:hypothetical protein [Bradyrhizobium betae]RXT42891.1 hypothetical protein B5V03_23990 [Bradyrhizobium betae]